MSVKKISTGHRWYRTRKELYNQVRHQVRLRLGPSYGELKSYEQRYSQEFSGRWELSSMAELLNAIQRTDVVVGGDFHVFAQAQRTHLRILRALPANLPVVLVMECFESNHQKYLDAYISHQLTEDEFLAKVEWSERWGFPWHHYRPLMELAKKRKYKVRGANRHFKAQTLSTLNRRDQHAAKVVQDAYQKHQDHLIYVIYGDLHLAHNHLPQQLREVLGKKVNTLIVFQNSEKLYFQLSRRGEEHDFDVLKRSSNRFCVQSSPPWVKWQTYLMYLDENHDVDLEDEEDDAIDYTDYLSAQIRFLLKDLEIQLKVDDIEVYTPKDDELWDRLEKDLQVDPLRRVEYLASQDRSFFLPSEGLFYFSRISLNHAAELAGQYIQAKLTKRSLNPSQYPRDFEAQVWLEGLGFFSSKMVNHKRKAENITDFKSKIVGQTNTDCLHQALLLALDQRMIEFMSDHLAGKTIERKIRPRSFKVYVEAARLLGQMFGDRLFESYRDGEVSQQDVADVFKTDISSSEFKTVYYRWMKRLEEFGDPL